MLRWNSKTVDQFGYKNAKQRNKQLVRIPHVIPLREPTPNFYSKLLASTMQSPQDKPGIWQSKGVTPWLQQ